MQRPGFSLTEEEMARAMYASDRSYDGFFYTCVTSTGIFCFPSCPARKPHLKNVRFAHTRDDAINWGFRPCKRCRPDLAAGRQTYEAALVAKVHSLVEERLDHISIDDLATGLSLSPDHLMRLFRRAAGVTIHEYIRRRRIDQARDQLQTGRVSVLDIGIQVGFESPSAFYAAFSRIVGMPPGEYRHRVEKGAADRGE
jgi:methylphosphotriester-DNA--protein-cysteine methyltransferase